MNKDNVDVSIIVPVYNDGNNISRVIKKLLAEKRINIEIILVNDGSVDNTLDVINSFNDKRLLVINQENLGVYAARNAALAKHSGKWLMLLDSDDDFAEDLVFDRYNEATKHDVDVLISNGRIVDEHDSFVGEIIHRKQIYNHVISGNQWVEHAVKNNEWPHYLWLQMIRSEYIKKNSLTFNAGYSHQDILWTAMLGMYNGRFYISDRSDYFYVNNPHSITKSKKYYDCRAYSYIEVISKLILLANGEVNAGIKKAFLRHASHECRHFFGLYRKKVSEKKAVKAMFMKKISFSDLFRGASTCKQYWLLMRLYRILKAS
ncbi:glycosyltransferase [Dryocola clanedunensis]|uniref:glycosyltransferase n=1 Tax=Cedecea sulfonylureivorans TaxID=3051154 RepID=UPI0019264DB4